MTLNYINVVSSGIYDICELLSPGEGLRDILDGAVNNSTDNLDVFDGYNTSEPNACSADFLQEQLKSLNDCFPLSLPEAFDISTYKEMVEQLIVFTLFFPESFLYSLVRQMRFGSRFAC